MGLGIHAARTLLAGTVLLGSLSAAPAFPQTLTVELGGPVDTSSTASPAPLTAASPISFGGSGDYVARIANAATGTAATGVKLAVPAPAILDAGLGIGALSVSGGKGCTTDANTGAMTCDIPDVPVGASVDVPFSVALPVPKVASASGDEVIPSDPAFCPSDAAGTVLGPVTPTVTVATGTVTQATPAPTTVSKYADLSADLQGPPSASQGQVITFDATIKNNGPCPSVNVLVDTTVGAGLVFQSATGACTSEDPCSLGTMAPGQTASFRKTYRVATLQNSLTTSSNPNSITVHSGDSSDPTNVIPGTDDPDGSNDSPATRTLVQSSTGGCSSAGSAAPWVTAVLALLGLALRRRRVA